MSKPFKLNNLTGSNDVQQKGSWIFRHKKVLDFEKCHFWCHRIFQDIFTYLNTEIIWILSIHNYFFQLAQKDSQLYLKIFG